MWVRSLCRPTLHFNVAPFYKSCCVCLPAPLCCLLLRRLVLCAVSLRRVSLASRIVIGVIGLLFVWFIFFPPFCKLLFFCVFLFSELYSHSNSSPTPVILHLLQVSFSSFCVEPAPTRRALLSAVGLWRPAAMLKHRCFTPTQGPENFPRCRKSELCSCAWKHSLKKTRKRKMFCR